MLEAVKHVATAFVTLTYASKHLPKDASLRPEDVQLWLKRIRKEAGKLRYFLVGEYGDEEFRPHYHAAVFGLSAPNCLLCSNQYHRDRCDCLVATTWGMGQVFVGSLTADSASYIAGYILKKMRMEDRLKRPCRYEETCKDKFCSRKEIMHPPFNRMSLKPGIGADAMNDIANTLNTDLGCESIMINGDVPFSLNYGKKTLPLGRYLTKRLRKEAGLDEEKIKTDSIRRWSLEMVEGYAAMYRDSSNSNKSLAQILTESTKQQALNQEMRTKLFGRRKKL